MKVFDYFKRTYKNPEDEQNIEKENKISFYIDCYLKELQRHFDVPERRMRIILFKVYKKMCANKKLEEFFSKIKISMLKSFKKEYRE